MKEKTSIGCVLADGMRVFSSSASHSFGTFPAGEGFLFVCVKNFEPSPAGKVARAVRVTDEESERNPSIVFYQIPLNPVGEGLAPPVLSRKKSLRKNGKIISSPTVRDGISEAVHLRTKNTAYLFQDIPYSCETDR